MSDMGLSVSERAEQALREHRERQTPASEKVSFFTTWDMYVLRFAQQVKDASSNRMTFSTRRYGILIGQLGTLQPLNTPTTAENVEDRIFMCMTRGCYSIERALVVYRTSRSYTRLNRLSLSDIIQHSQLMTLFVELTVTIFHETRVNAGLAYTTDALMLAVEKDRIDNLMAANKAAERKDEVSEGTLYPMEETLDAQLDKVTPREVEHFTNLRNQPLAHFHRLMRLCADACYLPEDSYILRTFRDGVPMLIWDIPTNTPADALTSHFTGLLVQSIQFCCSFMMTTEQAIIADQYRTTRKFVRMDDVLQWMLADHNRLVCMANMVACQYNVSVVMGRQSNVRLQAVNRMRRVFNDIVCYLALILAPSIDVTSWLAKADPKRFR